tara:strand:- start:906 stop:1925 length:1020 start_codon:yes stop_codon:yes gene_type:complete
MIDALLKDMKNPRLYNDLIVLFFVKIVLGIIIYAALIYSGIEYPFNFHDFANLYRTCSSININIGFTQLVCIADIESVSQPLPIVLSIFLMMISLILIYCAFFNFLNRNGQMLLMLMLIFHPYLIISTFRLTTDLFALLAISITAYYIMRDIKLSKTSYVIILGLILFRYHLAVIYLPLFIFIAFDSWKQKKKIEFMNIFSILIIAIGVASAFSYATMFAGNNKGFDLQTLILNAIYLFGFREMVGINGIAEFLCCNILWHNIQFIISLCLICIHLIGLIGVWKISKVTNFKILIIFIYLIPCILIIGHLRFLLPLIPILLGGTAYLVAHKSKLNKYIS